MSKTKKRTYVVRFPRLGDAVRVSAASAREAAIEGAGTMADFRDSSAYEWAVETESCSSGRRAHWHVSDDGGGCAISTYDLRCPLCQMLQRTGRRKRAAAPAYRRIGGGW